MELNLKRPIVFLDLETTGTNVGADRIVEIGLLKIFPNGSKDSRTYKVNPTIPIPEETSKIHGIYDKDVKDAPTFKDLSAELNTFLGGSDLGGYNSNKFDIPLLIEEFTRCNIDFDILIIVMNVS